MESGSGGSGVRLMMRATPRKGTATGEGYKLFSQPRYSLTGYAPSDLTLAIGDTVEYRANTYVILGPPIWTTDRRMITLDVEQAKQ